jgi:hypothetical protein
LPNKIPGNIQALLSFLSGFLNPKNHPTGCQLNPMLVNNKAIVLFTQLRWQFWEYPPKPWTKPYVAMKNTLVPSHHTGWWNGITIMNYNNSPESEFP